MTRKTYGVSGLMEWQAVIRCGRATVNVLFTGGSVTGYGVSPAEYTTENPVVQAIIEGSEYYKSGRIRLLRQSGVAATADASATVAREAAVMMIFDVLFMLESSTSFFNIHHLPGRRS